MSFEATALDGGFDAWKENYEVESVETEAAAK
jgi:hypothetical protein